MSTKTIYTFFPEGVEVYNVRFLSTVFDFTNMLSKNELIKDIFPDGFCLYDTNGESMNSNTIIPNRIRIRLPKKLCEEWSDPKFISLEELDHWNSMFIYMKKQLE
jgi:hypothetical protein